MVYDQTLQTAGIVTHRHMQKQKKEMEAKEFESLQDSGFNPYEVYRKRDMAAAAAKEAVALAAGQVQRLKKVHKLLQEEEKEYQKRLAKHEAERQIEDKYQKEMGVSSN